MEPFKIFVVDDDRWYADILEYQLLLNPDYEVEKYYTAKDCLKNLYKKPSLITLDFSLPDMDGNEVLSVIKKSYPDLPVIIVSGQENIKTVVGLLKNGAYDYIVKDEDTRERLWNSVRNARENLRLRTENEHLKAEVSKKYVLTTDLIGESPAMQKLLKLIEKAAGSSIAVSITGETGTGKELVAKTIHYNSNRRKNTFMAINVSAIPSELIESELFGYEKGAFTGATSQRIGKFEEASNGTLFLDEIAEMDLHMQAKLLRVLQEMEITRIGSNKPQKIDIHLITATHKNLAEEVKKGNFRADLYYRLIGMPIEIAPLRERKEDILVLTKKFLTEYGEKNKIPVPTLTAEAKEKLLNYSYPGNIRELKAVAELALIMSNGREITASDVTFMELDSLTDMISRETTLDNYICYIVQHFLEKYDNNAILVAKKLDIGKSTIYRMIKKYGL